MRKLLLAKTVVLPDQLLTPGAVLIEDNVILKVGNCLDDEVVDERIDFEDAIISPGFFDLHIHGCMGQLTEDGPEAIIHLSNYLPTTGTTSFLVTAMTRQGLVNAEKAMSMPQKSQIKGIHMEGPFLSPRNMEAADKSLVKPSLEALDDLLKLSNHIVMMGLGVEQPGAKEVISKLKEMGIVASCAHTKATYDEIVEAQKWGLTHGTHLYNVMTGLHHRRPGAVGAILTSDDMTTELICDGVHIHPAAIDVAIKCKGFDRIAMITDMTLGGIPDGDYDNGTYQVQVRDNIARFKGIDPDADHAIAGSTRPMLSGIKTVCELGIPLYQAVRMATLTPARIVHMEERFGSLEVGKDADIVVFTKDYQTIMTMIQGNIVYRRNS